jgi:hypothetical protein
VKVLKRNRKFSPNSRTLLQNPEIEFAQEFRAISKFMEINSLMIFLIFEERIFKKSKIPAKVFILFQLFRKIERVSFAPKPTLSMETILFKIKIFLKCNENFTSNRKWKNQSISKNR